MNSPLKKIWELNETVKHTEILSTISSSFDVKVSSAKTSYMQFYDDFDNHLWKADYLLCKTDSQCFQLIDQSNDIDETTAPGDAKFWWQFPEGKTKNILQQFTGLRAISPVASLNLTEWNYSLRNSDQKTVVKGRLTQWIDGNKTIQYFTLQALRGYTKYFTKAAESLEPIIKAENVNFGFRFMLLHQTTPIFESIVNTQPTPTPDTPTEQAVRMMAVALIEQAKLHVNGVVTDIDTEFLHQFRVNFRKLRSLISLLKRSLPTSTIEILKPKLSSISCKTNKLRDLDVFLLDKDKYRAILPDYFKNGLSELYVIIEKQRKEEQSKISEYFSSNTWIDDIATCSAVLLLAPSLQTSMASKPVLRVAKKLILQSYQKIQVISSAINKLSPDEEVHALRIEFKKLRYLIEFFVDLLPKKRTDKLVGEIKKIQTVLGNFNDYCTQIIFLNAYVDDNKIEMSKTLYGLIAVLHQKQIEERLKVDDTLSSFFTPNMTIEFNFLFGDAMSGESK